MSQAIESLPVTAVPTTPYSPQALVDVYPFTRQQDSDEETLIGRIDTNTFLALPNEAIEILDDLAAGKTIQEAQELYQQRHGELPDLVDFLEQLEGEGFVQPLSSTIIRFRDLQSSAAVAGATTSTTAQPKQVRFHFTFFPVRLAQWLCNPIMLAVYVGIMVIAFTIMMVEPSLIPTWQALFFTENIAFYNLMIILHGFVITFFHEIGHAIAARSRGIDVRFGISRRLWIFVAETDMTGIWSIPRRQRYLPLFGGMIVDLTTAALIIIVLYGNQQRWFSIAPVFQQLLPAFLLSYLLNILFQFYFFVRTDFYYFLSTFFRCTNLMQDTRNYILNKWYTLLRKQAPVDQSSIPQREVKVIKVYSFFWILGRVLAIGALILITLPLLWNYSFLIFNRLTTAEVNSYQFLDTMLATVLVFFMQALGIVLWLRSLILRKVSTDDL